MEIRSRANQSLKKNLSKTKKKYGIRVKLRKRTSKKKIKFLCKRGNLMRELQTTDVKQYEAQIYFI